MNESDYCKDIKNKFYKEDKYPRGLGIDIVELIPGYCVTCMEVTEEKTNFHRITHGGALFSLADTAFGLASNSRGPAVAMQVNINYLAPSFPGDKLKATAREENLTRSTGVYDVTVQNQENETVALFRGVVYRKQDKTG